MYKTKIATIKEFQKSKDIWNKLALSMNLPSIFCTWEWIYTWWEHFGKNYEPVILFIYKDAELVGVLPLAHDKVRKGALFSRKLSYCGSMELYPDHLDIICSKEDAEQCLDAVFEFLKTEYKEWDVLNISLLSEGSNILDYLNRKDFYFNASIRQSSVAPFITLSGSFDNYLNSFDSKKRYNLKKKQRRLYEQGFKYTSFSGATQNNESLKTLFELHKKRAEKKNILSTFQGEHLFKFHDIFSQRISKNGWLWLRFLEKEKETIAVLYGFVFNGHLFYYQLGIDYQWGDYSPGTVIFYEVIKEAFSKGYKEFDFLRGDEEYKSKWTKNKRLLYKIIFYNNTISAKILHKILQSGNIIRKGLRQSIA